MHSTAPASSLDVEFAEECRAKVCVIFLCSALLYFPCLKQYLQKQYRFRVNLILLSLRMLCFRSSEDHFTAPPRWPVGSLTMIYNSALTLHVTVDVIEPMVSSGDAHETHPFARLLPQKELVKDGKITIHHVATQRLLADVGTKFHTKNTHRHLLNLIEA